jgi:hypothetical protein
VRADAHNVAGERQRHLHRQDAVPR